MIARIKNNDTVAVIRGKDKGKQGTVVAINTDKVIVKGAALITKHVKPRQGEAGGIKKQEGYLPISHVMPVCSACKKPCRVISKVVDNNKKVRACHRCQESI